MLYRTSFILLFTIYTSVGQTYYCQPDDKLSISTNPSNPFNAHNLSKINKFDWTQQYYTIYDSDKGWLKVLSPFNYSSNEWQNEINESKDYTPSNGWEILNISGIAIDDDTLRYGGLPSLLLYNKYSGKIRFFVMLDKVKIPADYTKLLLHSYRFHNNNSLSYSPTFFSNQSYSHSLNNFNKDEGLGILYPYYEGRHIWNRSEINIEYDPCSCIGDNINIVISSGILSYKEILIEDKQAIQYRTTYYGSILFSLPGIEWQSHIKSYYPYYNNILGVFNLLQTPEIDYVLFKDNNYRLLLKLTNDLDYVLNPAAGFNSNNSKLYAKYILQYDGYPTLTAENTITHIGNDQFESEMIPLNCLKDYTLDISAYTNQVPKRVSLEILGEFEILDSNSANRKLNLSKIFTVNLNNQTGKIAPDMDYWTNTYNGNCNLLVLPYNLNYQKMYDFCFGNNYIIKERYVWKRANKSVIDSIETIFIEKEDSFKFFLYPNPCSNDLFIKIALNDDSEIKFSIVDRMGRIDVKNQSKSQIERGVNTIIFDIQHLASGAYYLLIEFNKEKIIKPFLKI